MCKRILLEQFHALSSSQEYMLHVEFLCHSIGELHLNLLCYLKWVAFCWFKQAACIALELEVECIWIFFFFFFFFFFFY